MSKLWEQMLLIPTVVSLTSRAPRDPAVAWDGYWSRIRTTGHSGDVLWDSESRIEHAQYSDVGCGNGTHTRWLASLFPSVLGIDVSTGAVELAKKESEDVHNADFMVMDAAGVGAGKHLLERMGPANIFVRGVLHVLKPDKQSSLAANLRTVIGSSGRIFLAETNFHGNSLAYLQQLGATPRNMPRQLQLALENLPRPGRFGPQERHNTFSNTVWQLIAEGPVNIEVVPMESSRLSRQVPGYFALLASA
jgi:SAM-dependent methyltransferase